MSPTAIFQLLEGYFWLEMLKTGFKGCKVATVPANADQFLFKCHSGLFRVHWNTILQYMV